VGANVVQSIIATRDKKGRYTSFTDFLDKVDLVVCNKRVIESLIKAGAFDSFGHTRLSLIRVHEEAVDAVTGLKRHEAMGQFDLFGGGDDDADGSAPDSSPLAHLTFGPDEWPRKQLLAYEREMLGLYVSAHPLDGAEWILRKHAPKPIAALLDEAPKEGEVVVSGMIASIDRRVNKNGEPWAIVTLEDLDASMEVLFFAKSYSALHEDLVPDTAVAIQGRVNWRDEKMSVFGSGVIPLDISDAEHNPRATVAFVLHAEATQLSQAAIIELRSALVAHKGDTPVHIVVRHNGRETALTVDDYPVNVCSALRGEIKSIRGITVAA
jgi:DNA polymerase-3 subunit alpha